MALVQSVIDEVKSFVEPATKLNKRQALSQGVNLGAQSPSISQPVDCVRARAPCEFDADLASRLDHHLRADDMEDLNPFHRQ